jgi:hypothetical protein
VQAVRIERLTRRAEGGYVAVMTGLMLLVFMGLSAFAVDVGHWYQVAQQEQRAADSAAMAGVTYLPTNPASAFSTAQNYSKINGFENGVSATTVTPAVDLRPSRLRVTVTKTVNNFFGSLLGIPTTRVSRTAVADYAQPVSMGSPCNEYGQDPDPGSNRGAACSGVLGQFWANVNSPNALKSNGDAYQGNAGCGPLVDGCTGAVNDDYTKDGYYYTLSVKKKMTGLTIQLFDPVSVEQGSACDVNFGSDPTAATDAKNGVVNEKKTYLSGPSEYCTGDVLFSGSQVQNTQFTILDPGSNPWDTGTFQKHLPEACQKTYGGYAGGDLFHVLDKKDALYDPEIVDGFRRWTTLCTIANPVVGDYLIQVKSNVGGVFDNADANNGFSMRAFGSSNSDKDSISIGGREKMAVFSNRPDATTEFHLARVGSGSAGQTLNVRLWDVGDTLDPNDPTPGTIQVIYPPDAGGALSFTNCVGVLSNNPSVPLPDCSLKVTRVTHNGKWQSIAVPIPAGYSCTDSDPAKCWVRLRYIYGSSSPPTDATSWSVSMNGDSVRLVE